jgi:CBS domain-containing protein
MSVGTLFTHEVITVSPQDSLATVTRTMKEHSVGTVVVAEQGRPVGIITDRDLALSLGSGEVSRTDSAQSIMTCPITTIDRNQGIFQATRQLSENALRRLPVVDEVGRVVGVLSADDLLLLLSRELANVAKAIEPEMAVR